MRKSLMVWMVVGLITLVFLGPQPAGAQKNPILVGFPMILSGGGALFGEPAKVGAEMAVKEYNAKGGVLGRPLELLVRDCKGTPEEATRATKELILKENVQFVVGGLTASQGVALWNFPRTKRFFTSRPFPSPPP